MLVDIKWTTKDKKETTKCVEIDEFDSLYYYVMIDTPVDFDYIESININLNMEEGE